MKLTSLILSILAATAAGTASCHDLAGIATVELASASREIADALAQTPVADERTRSVLSNLRLWSVPRKLTICFIGGTPELRKAVTTAMREMWQIGSLSGGRLDYDGQNFDKAEDCKQDPAQDLRVSFKERIGNWSYVGMESLEHTPSMNFDRIDTMAADDLRAYVAHEMGHALGLEHEHQSPAIPGDCGWNFDYISKAYQWNSDDEMRFNLNKLPDYLKGGKHAYIFSSYDKTSVMHYVFEPAAFMAHENSPCYVKDKNNVPSDVDRSAIRVAYGSRIVAEQALAREAIPEIWQKFSGPGFANLQRVLSRKSYMIKN